MMFSQHQFEISQLRQQNVVKMVEAIALFVACLFVTAFLPQLLFKYFYANQQLTEQPALFDYIQVGSFLVGIVFFLISAVGNLKRSMRIRKLEKEMQSSDMMDGSCCSGCGGMCSCGEHDGCACGCETDMMSEEKMDSAVKMMEKAGGRRKSSKK